MGIRGVGGLDGELGFGGLGGWGVGVGGGVRCHKDMQAPAQQDNNSWSQ